MGRKRKIDKVRASRDGHEFHEAWTARKAMQLLLPDSELTAIAVEGLSPSDQATATAAAIEVADLTFYHGGEPNFEDSTHTTIAQFKYSIAGQNEDFRASHAKKTVKKFGATYRSFKRKYGAEAVEEKLDFQLITNQPIYALLIDAIDATANGTTASGDVKVQAEQFKTASGLSGKTLKEFARKLKIVGRSKSLPQKKIELANLLIDWSATSDSIATARLGKLRELVRDKAGYAGTDENLIMRTDVLAALQIGDQSDLLPCETALVDIGEVLEREQLNEAVSRISSSSLPLLIHATGGVGKTVFMDSLASKIATDYEVVFFDCFGGGAYRSPEDARHLPKKGLIHIANTLAFRGLCDPMLPGSPDVQALLSTFRRRLIDCQKTISRMVPGRKLAIFIDAIDNAVFAAGQASDDCFPIKLLESLDAKPIYGVKLIVSCRTERKPKTYTKFDELELSPFTKNETAAFLRARLKRVTTVDINVAQARSCGNPRVLDYLIKTDRGLLDPSGINNSIELDDLIQQRITDALSLAVKQGYEEKDICAFLAGLAVLPPPVPVDEYAAAHGIERAAIESFASDLNPLLERTKHGLMFRDEPTETLIHKQYATSLDALERVATNLLARQDVSVYAARSLPRLLHELDDGERLFALAFDERIPVSITSTVGKRNIQYARLKSATLHAALKLDYNSLVRLLVELSTLAEVEQRGTKYLLKYPDLIVAAKDVDAQRRLFETRTDWPGTRHACLFIVNMLSGDVSEATRHAYANEEWIQHYRRTARRNKFDRKPIPDRIDIAASCLYLISENRTEDAAGYLTGWRGWFAFEVTHIVLGYLQLAITLGILPARRADDFIEALSGIGPLIAALSYNKMANSKRKIICSKLASICKRKKLDLPNGHLYRKSYRPEGGVRKSAAIALSLGLGAEAQIISLRSRHDRPGIWSFRGETGHTEVFAYIFRVALLAAVNNRTIHERDMLPEELNKVCKCIPRTITGKSFRTKAREILSKLPLKRSYDNGNTRSDPLYAISNDEKQVAERYLDYRLEPLLTLTKALSTALAASSRTIDKHFVKLVDVWGQVRMNRDYHRVENIDYFFQFLGFEAVFIILESRNELKPQSINHMLTVIHAHMNNASSLIRIISVLAQRNSLHPIAGEQALKTCAMIEKDDDVTYRASLYGDLGRAILPASPDEAAVYFRNGLEQMDAIGSGDYQFTNELLMFASEMKGDELDERDFHTLSNICELNMGEEPEKFPWGAYGRGMAKAAGIRGLAKLSRWDDRDRIALSNTLLPYLTGLLETGKIDPMSALCLNRLANPVEYYYAGTKEFAEAVSAQAGHDAEIVTELISQYEDNNPTIASDDTLNKLLELATEALGKSHSVTKHLSSSRDRYYTARKGRDVKYGSSTDLDPTMRKKLAKSDDVNREALARIAAVTDPVDEASLVKAIDEFNALGNVYDLKDGFFSALRDKVPYDARGQYVSNISNLEHLFFYWKFAELKNAKEAWASSSISLAGVFKNIAQPLIRTHAVDLIDDGRLSGWTINEISEFTGAPKAELIVEVIKIFSRSDRNMPGTVWFAIANFICPVADTGQGQLALSRLLSSDSARIANNVTDGAWKAGCYPTDDFTETAAGLVWRVLGSPYAHNRWRAAHCIRKFAKYGRWDIVDKVVEAFGAKTATPFQAPELAFYYFHARLWLLIAVARAAIDHPEQVARYKELLLNILIEKNEPHVLMRQFAASALLACVDRGKLTLEEDTLNILHNTNKSLFSRLKNDIRNRSDSYHGRPESVPEPSYEFRLEYDFNKYDVDSLGRVFGKACWEVGDMISSIVKHIDPSITHMYEGGGRESHGRSSYGMSTDFHNYGQQIGLHALFIAAGKLLADCPVTDGWLCDDDPWEEWIGHYGLTRKDGLWLSDGTDRTPDDISVMLLEYKKDVLSITGDQKKILQLANLNLENNVGSELVVEGKWFSADGIRIRVSSVLVSPQKAALFARKLIREEPIIVWIPAFESVGGTDEYLNSDKAGFTPWIVYQSGASRLDEHDPYGVSAANLRPRLSQTYTKYCKLKRQDEFGRSWTNNHGIVSLRAEAWGRDKIDGNDSSYQGLRLLCKTSLLKRVLSKYGKDLLLLFDLQRYEKKTHLHNSRYSHTIGVATIDKSLKVKYFKGRVNYLHESKW